MMTKQEFFLDLHEIAYEMWLLSEKVKGLKTDPLYMDFLYLADEFDNYLVRNKIKEVFEEIS